MDDLNSLMKELEEFVVDGSNEILDELNKGIISKTPVDTGFLRSRQKITKKISRVGETGEIENDAGYGGWVEYGSATIREHAMYRRTIQELQAKYK